MADFSATTETIQIIRFWSLCLEVISTRSWTNSANFIVYSIFVIRNSALTFRHPESFCDKLMILSRSIGCMFYCYTMLVILFPTLRKKTSETLTHLSQGLYGYWRHFSISIHVFGMSQKKVPKLNRT